MITGISLKDGSYVDVRQIALVQPDKMDWCRVTLESGIQFDCQDYERIKNAINEHQANLDNLDNTVHFLACVGEECGEIQQEIGKAVRFGIDDINPVTNEKNGDAIIREFNDLCGAMITLFNCPLDDLFQYQNVNAKSKKIMKWLEHSKKTNK